jgi:hypothetical protein
MTVKNYFREGQLGQRLAELGVREIEIETYLVQDRSGDRTLDLDAMNTAWAEAEKKTFPQRWLGGQTDEEQLARQACGLDGQPPSITAQGQLVLRYGEKQAGEMMDRLGSKLGTTKQGTDPKAAETEKQHANNPWAATAANVDPKTGKYTSAAITRQFSTTRAVGLAKAQGIAAAVNSRPGDLRPGMLKRTA